MTKVLDLRWRPALLAGTLCFIAFLCLGAGWREVTKPIRIGEPYFGKDEIEGAYLGVAALIAASGAVALGSIIWAQKKAVRIYVNREKEKVLVARGVPIAWSKQVHDIGDAMLVFETRQRSSRAPGYGPLYVVVIAVAGRRYDVDFVGSEEYATRRIDELSRTTGIPS